MSADEKSHLMYPRGTCFPNSFFFLRLITVFEKKKENFGKKSEKKKKIQFALSSFSPVRGLPTTLSLSLFCRR